MILKTGAIITINANGDVITIPENTNPNCSKRALNNGNNVVPYRLANNSRNQPAE
jgi:hypothetical protein